MARPHAAGSPGRLTEPPPLPAAQPRRPTESRSPRSDPGREPRPLDSLARSRHAVAPHERPGTEFDPAGRATGASSSTSSTRAAVRAPPDAGRRPRHRPPDLDEPAKLDTTPTSPSLPTAARSRYALTRTRPRTISTRGRSTVAEPPRPIRRQRREERIPRSPRTAAGSSISRTRPGGRRSTSSRSPGRESGSRSRPTAAPSRSGRGTARSSTGTTTRCGWSRPPRRAARVRHAATLFAFRSCPAGRTAPDVYDVAADGRRLLVVTVPGARAAPDRMRHRLDSHLAPRWRRRRRRPVSGWRPARASAPTRSSASSAPAGWARCGGRVDTRLDREVAIKVLPEGLVDDPERRARFEREAKVLASLNHPNIATLYGLERRSTAGTSWSWSWSTARTSTQRLKRGADPARRGAADRAADRRGARGGARARHRPPRPQAGQRQACARTARSRCSTSASPRRSGPTRSGRAGGRPVAVADAHRGDSAAG